MTVARGVEPSKEVLDVVDLSLRVSGSGFRAYSEACSFGPSTRFVAPDLVLNNSSSYGRADRKSHSETG